MKLILTPIEMLQAPNLWSPTGNTFWQVVGGVAVDLWGVLQVIDNLGTRPYTPSVGATLQAVFQRGDLVGVPFLGLPSTQTPNTYTVTKTCTFDTNNRSLIKMGITAQEATNITSGTIVFTLTQGSAVEKWAQNWAVQKLNTTAGF